MMGNCYDCGPFQGSAEDHILGGPHIEKRTARIREWRNERAASLNEYLAKKNMEEGTNDQS